MIVRLFQREEVSQLSLFYQAYIGIDLHSYAESVRVNNKKVSAFGGDFSLSPIFNLMAIGVQLDLQELPDH